MKRLQPRWTDLVCVVLAVVIIIFFGWVALIACAILLAIPCSSRRVRQMFMRLRNWKVSHGQDDSHGDVHD